MAERRREKREGKERGKGDKRRGRGRREEREIREEGGEGGRETRRERRRRKGDKRRGRERRKIEGGTSKDKGLREADTSRYPLHIPCVQSLDNIERRVEHFTSRDLRKIWMYRSFTCGMSWQSVCMYSDLVREGDFVFLQWSREKVSDGL